MSVAHRDAFSHDDPPFVSYMSNSASLSVVQSYIVDIKNILKEFKNLIKNGVKMMKFVFSSVFIFIEKFNKNDKINKLKI